jgi:phage tail-like protein
MSELRPFSLVRSGDQWARCSHDATFLDAASGTVELAWTSEADAALPSAIGVAGLAFDAHCRLLHCLPAAGRVERLRWAAIDPAAPAADQPAAVDLFAPAPPSAFGDFGSAPADAGLAEPRGLAIDGNDRLFIAETGADRILVFDLWEQRLLQHTALAAGARPTDLAAQGLRVLAVLAGTGQVVRLGARSTPVPVALPPGCTGPSRVALSPAGRLAVLATAGDAAARVWFTEAGWPDFAVPCATDLEWESEDVLVVARSPGADFLRMRVGRGLADVLSPLRARGYDGAGIVALPAQGSVAARRIGFWTAHGPRAAVAARVVYERRGRVTTYRLDSGSYQTEWGRVFLDACIPPGADVRLACISADDTDDAAEMPRSVPANLLQLTLRRPDLSPPMPPLDSVPGPGEVVQPLHRRESGRERPWTQLPADDPFETYEAPVIAGPGRYLWLVLELRGNTRVSPKLRCLRAEHPTHDYLRRLPRTFSRDPVAASFLQRYLAMFEGLLGETEARAVDRDLLLEPRTAPAEVLPWLASFLGLVLDERWAQAPAPAGQPPRDVRRDYIAQVAWLFRFRGTLPGLKRFIEIYTGVPVVILEHYRLRGLGSVVLGDADVPSANSVVGYGFRVGGEVGSEVATPISGSVADAFLTHAHRFTVIIPAALDAEQLSVVEQIVQVHRPAHTLFELCTVDAGMRLGIGLLLEVSSVVGRSGGFGRMQLGASALGRGSLLGRPAAGARLGSAALGTTLQVG